MGPATAEERQAVIASDINQKRYAEPMDPRSAHEVLTERIAERQKQEQADPLPHGLGADHTIGPSGQAVDPGAGQQRPRPVKEVLVSADGRARFVGKNLRELVELLQLCHGLG